MPLPYHAALAKLAGYIAAFDVALYGPRQEQIEAVRISLRERRDYWHVVASKVRARQERERKRRFSPLPQLPVLSEGWDGQPELLAKLLK